MKRLCSNSRCRTCCSHPPPRMPQVRARVGNRGSTAGSTSRAAGSSLRSVSEVARFLPLPARQIVGRQVGQIFNKDEPRRFVTCVHGCGALERLRTKSGRPSAHSGELCEQRKLEISDLVHHFREASHSLMQLEFEPIHEGAKHDHLRTGGRLSSEVQQPAECILQGRSRDPVVDPVICLRNEHLIPQCSLENISGARTCNLCPDRKRKRCTSVTMGFGSVISFTFRKNSGNSEKNRMESAVKCFGQHREMDSISTKYKQLNFFHISAIEMKNMQFRKAKV